MAPSDTHARSSEMRKTAATHSGATTSNFSNYEQLAPAATRNIGPDGGSSLSGHADAQSVQQTVSMLDELKRTNCALMFDVVELLKRATGMENKAARLKQAWMMERSRRERAQTWFMNFREEPPVLQFNNVFRPDKIVLAVHEDQTGQFIEELDATTIDKPEYADLVHWHLYNAESDDEEDSQYTALASSSVHLDMGPESITSSKEPPKTATDIARVNANLNNAKPHLSERHSRPLFSCASATGGQLRGQKRTAIEMDDLIFSQETKRLRCRADVQPTNGKSNRMPSQEKAKSSSEHSPAQCTPRHTKKAPTNFLNSQCPPPSKEVPEDCRKIMPLLSPFNEDLFVTRAKEIFQRFPFTRPDPLASPPVNEWSRSQVDRVRTPELLSDREETQVEYSPAPQNEPQPTRKQDIAFIID